MHFDDLLPYLKNNSLWRFNFPILKFMLLKCAINSRLAVSLSAKILVKILMYQKKKKTRSWCLILKYLIHAQLHILISVLTNATGDVSNICVPATHEGEMDCIPRSSSLWPGLVIAVVGIWRVNQQMGSLSHYISNK